MLGFRIRGADAENASTDGMQVAKFDAEAWSAARARWDDATAAVDRQIGQLQSVLRASDDPELKSIGEYGLNSVTGRRRAALTAALLQVGDGKGAPNALKAIRDYGRSCSRTKSSRRATAIRSVAVSIRGTLGAALEAMEKALGG